MRATLIQRVTALRLLSIGCLMVIAVAVAFPVTYQLRSSIRLFGVNWTTALAPNEEKLANLPSFAVIEAIRAQTANDALVLALRPADLYYSGRRMLSYLDPRLLEFYEARDAQSAIALLKGLGVSHVYVPDYSLPVVYNSPLLDILANEKYSRIISYAAGYALHELVPTAADLRPDPGIDFSPEKYAWTRFHTVSAGIARLLRRPRFVSSADIPAADELPIFSRQQGSFVMSGKGLPESRSLSPVSVLGIASGTEYRVDLQVSGNGYVRLVAVQMNSLGDHIGSTTLFESALSESGTRIARRFISRSDARYVRFILEELTPNPLRIVRARLTRVGPVDPAGASEVVARYSIARPTTFELGPQYPLAANAPALSISQVLHSPVFVSTPLFKADQCTRGCTMDLKLEGTGTVEVEIAVPGRIEKFLRVFELYSDSVDIRSFFAASPDGDFCVRLKVSRGGLHREIPARVRLQRFELTDMAGVLAQAIPTSCGY